MQMLEEEEADEDAAEDLVDEADEDDASANRRRSSRARKTPIAFTGLDDDYEDSRLDYITKPVRCVFSVLMLCG